MHPILITVAGVAQPAGSKIGFQTSSGRIGVRDDAKKSRPWKTRVADKALDVMHEQGLTMLDGPLVLEVVFYIPRPNGHYGKRGLRPAAPEYPAVRPDCLKLTRGVEDALTGICWRDDAQVVHEVLTKLYGDPARVDIAIAPAHGYVARWQHLSPHRDHPDQQPLDEETAA